MIDMISKIFEMAWTHVIKKSIGLECTTTISKINMLNEQNVQSGKKEGLEKTLVPT